MSITRSNALAFLLLFSTGACTASPGADELATQVAKGIAGTQTAEAAIETAVAERLAATQTALSRETTPSPTRPLQAATSTPTSTRPAIRTAPTNPYAAKVKELYLGPLQDFLDRWNAWLDEANRYVGPGNVMLQGYWDVFCGRGWFYNDLQSMKSELQALSPPDAYLNFHRMFLDVLDANLDQNYYKEILCSEGGWTDANWTSWVDSTTRGHDLVERLNGLYDSAF